MQELTEALAAILAEMRLHTHEARQHTALLVRIDATLSAMRAEAGGKEGEESEESEESNGTTPVARAPVVLDFSGLVALDGPMAQAPSGTA